MYLLWKSSYTMQIHYNRMYKLNKDNTVTCTSLSKNDVTFKNPQIDSVVYKILHDITDLQVQLHWNTIFMKQLQSYNNLLL